MLARNDDRVLAVRLPDSSCVDSRKAKHEHTWLTWPRAVMVDTYAPQGRVLLGPKFVLDAGLRRLVMFRRQRLIA
jgi:hypothetical protein